MEPLSILIDYTMYTLSLKGNTLFAKRKTSLEKNTTICLL